MAAQVAAAEAVPGVGWQAPLPQPPSSTGGLGNPGLNYPVVARVL
jgi:hypothetical protein